MTRSSRPTGAAARLRPSAFSTERHPVTDQAPNARAPLTADQIVQLLRATTADQIAAALLELFGPRPAVLLSPAAGDQANLTTTCRDPAQLLLLLLQAVQGVASGLGLRLQIGPVPAQRGGLAIAKAMPRGIS